MNTLVLVVASQIFSDIYSLHFVHLTFFFSLFLRNIIKIKCILIYVKRQRVEKKMWVMMGKGRSVQFTPMPLAHAEFRADN